METEMSIHFRKLNQQWIWLNLSWHLHRQNQLIMPWVLKHRVSPMTTLISATLMVSTRKTLVRQRKSNAKDYGARSLDTSEDLVMSVRPQSLDSWRILMTITTIWLILKAQTSSSTIRDYHSQIQTTTQKRITEVFQISELGCLLYIIKENHVLVKVPLVIQRS